MDVIVGQEPGNLSTSNLNIPERLERLPLSSFHRKIMYIAVIGWLLESLDLSITGTVLVGITPAFHLNAFYIALVGTATTYGTVIGLIPSGMLADRIGRKKVFILGFLMYTIATFISGLSPNVTTLIILRGIAGFGIGAVFPIPYGVITEFIPAKARGRYAGYTNALGLQLGYFLAPAIGLLLYPQLPSDIAWRVSLFVAGASFLLTPLIYKYLPESPRWLESHGFKDEASKLMNQIEVEVKGSLNIGELPIIAKLPDVSETKAKFPFRDLAQIKFLIPILFLAFAWMSNIWPFYIASTYLPSVLKSSYGFTQIRAFEFVAVIFASSIVGNLITGHLADRFGRKPILLVYYIIEAISVILIGSAINFDLQLVGGILLGFFGLSVYAALKPWTAEHFPTKARQTGSATVETIGRTFAGIVLPVFFVYEIYYGVKFLPFAVMAVLLIVSVIVAVSLGRETNNMVLEEIVS